MGWSEFAYKIVLTVLVGSVLSGIVWWSDTRLARASSARRQARARRSEEPPRRLDRAA